ncbi:MAG: DUF5671 domain-containing protein [Patescibacteria group bacterium]
MNDQNQNNHDAKFAFFYLLSLVALIFMSLSTGMVIFQAINKYISEIGAAYSARFSSDSLRFAISALVVSIPVFYVITSKIYKSLYRGALDPDSGIRKWLSYFILFISSVVMIVWVIITVNNFLDGELTLKFALKFLTVLVIAGTVFGFYLYDIKREAVKGVKDRVIKGFLYGTLFLTIAVFAGGLFMVESPWEAKAGRVDGDIVNNFNSIEYRMNDFYTENDRLPDSLRELEEENRYVNEDYITNPRTGKVYEYNVLSESEYELCADFETSNKERDGHRPVTLKKEWSHNAEYTCFELEAEKKK